MMQLVRQHVVTEQVVRFGPRGILVGVVARPSTIAESPGELGVLLINAGLLHRAGPNRLYVSLARDLAAFGLPVLRFDFAGLGDSGRRDGNVPLNQAVLQDIDDALTFGTEETGARSWLLIGHCSGAIAASYIAQSDPRISAILPINFPPTFDPNWVTVDRDEKNARFFVRYYINGALRDPKNWRRFLTGRVFYRRIFGGFAQSVVRAVTTTTITRLRSCISATTPDEDFALKAGDDRIDLDEIVRRGVAVHFLFSEGNVGLEYLRAATAGRLDTLLKAGKLTLGIVPRSDHLFSTAESQHRVREIARTFASGLQEPRELNGATL